MVKNECFSFDWLKEVNNHENLIDTHIQKKSSNALNDINENDEMIRFLWVSPKKISLKMKSVLSELSSKGLIG